MKHLQNIVLVILITILGACSSSDENPQKNDRGYEYLPMRKGLYHIYSVEEIVFELSVKETLRYELKTVVADSFPNAEGGFTYVIYRSKRNNPNDAWQSLDTWSMRINKTEAIRSHGNVPYVVLNFPPKQGVFWNGNAYNNETHVSNNSERTDEFSIISAGESYTIGENNFYEDCVVVEQEDNQEFVIYFDKRLEVYSKHIGLVYVETTQLKYCQEVSCINQQKVEDGVIYKQVLKEYGKQ